MITAPWAIGLETGDKVWVTVIECGAPVWKQASTVRPVKAGLKARVRLEDGSELEVHQHDIRSFSYLRKRTS